MTSSVRHRLLSILLVVLLASCASLKPSGLCRTDQPLSCAGRSLEVHTPLMESSRYVFKSALDIKGHHLTGLMYVKRMPDSTLRIAFLNEFGMTWFDFIIKPGSFSVAYCFDPLNKKPLLKIFRTNFELLFNSRAEHLTAAYRQKPSGNEVVEFRYGPYKIWYAADSSCRVVSLAGQSNFLDKTLITFASYKKDSPGSITITSPVVGLEMKLERDW